jgi:Ni,Fe-hydrogenase III component G
MGNPEAALRSARVLLARWEQNLTQPELNRLDLTLSASDLLPAVQTLGNVHWGYLAAITGLDLGLSAGVIEVLYHFCAGAAVVTLRVPVSRDEPVVPSVCGLIASASLFERELIEMFGVTVTDTPNPARLFLPDDWPEGVYPLRKNLPLSESKPTGGEI